MENNKHYEEEETQVVDSPIKEEEIVVADAATMEETGKKGPKGWKQVAIGTASGIMLGAAGVLFTSSVDPDNADDGGQDGSGHSGGEVHDDYDLGSVSDDMSFSDAFAAARAELGPGGVFEWHGNLYTTDTVEEWNAAHPQEDSDAGQDQTGDDGLVDDGQDIDSQIDADGQMSDETADDNDDIDAVAGEPADSDDGEIEILGYSTVEMEDGSMMNTGVLNMDGDDVLIIDVDNDSEYDIMVSDLDGDGSIGPDDVMGISDIHITTEEISSSFGETASDVDAGADVVL